MATVTEPVQKHVGLEPVQRFVVHAVEWSDYQHILQAFRERHFRITYDQGTLELMTKSIMHGHLSRLVFQMIVVLTDEMGVRRHSVADLTCDREDLERGAEPDEGFYLGDEPRVRNWDEIDLSVDPPPDLVVEVEISRSTGRRLGIYAALGVPEVWRCAPGSAIILVRGEDGQYVEADRSLHFPVVGSADLGRFLQESSQPDENALMQSFRDWVRERLGGQGKTA